MVRFRINTFSGNPNYIQHNPNIPHCKKPVVEFLVKLFRNPHMEVSIMRVIAEADLVTIYSHYKSSADDNGEAIIEIYRVDSNKIVEHWMLINLFWKGCLSTM